MNSFKACASKDKFQTRHFYILQNCLMKNTCFKNYNQTCCSGILNNAVTNE